MHFAMSRKQSPIIQDEVKEMKQVLYAIMVWCLIYDVICTKKGLGSIVSKYMSYLGKLNKM